MAQFLEKNPNPVLSVDFQALLDERHAFNEENIPVRTRGTKQDITERKKAEEILRLKLE